MAFNAIDGSMCWYLAAGPLKDHVESDIVRAVASQILQELKHGSACDQTGLSSRCQAEKDTEVRRVGTKASGPGQVCAQVCLLMQMQVWQVASSGMLRLHDHFIFRSFPACIHFSNCV